MLAISENQARLLRLRAQRLIPQFIDPSTGPAQVVREVCAIQAQEGPAAALAVRPRSCGHTAEQVERVRVEQRSLVRTWLLRGALHLVSSEDLDWLLPLLGPVFIERNRRRYRVLGLDEDAIHKGLETIREVLSSHGPLTRHDLAPYIRAKGVNTEGQALIHLISRAALEGLVCLGPDLGRQPSYVLVQEWLGRELAPIDAPTLEDLARRHLAAYAPAGPEDFSAWSGLPISQAREAWRPMEDGLVQVEFNKRLAWMPEQRLDWLDEIREVAPAIRLLPRFDAFLLGYANRELSVAPEFARHVNTGGGIIRPVVLVNGCVQGIWSVKRRSSSLEVLVEPFVDLTAQIIPGLESEIEDLGRFLDLPASYRIGRLAQNSN